MKAAEPPNGPIALQSAHNDEENTATQSRRYDLMIELLTVTDLGKQRTGRGRYAASVLLLRTTETAYAQGRSVFGALRRCRHRSAGGNEPYFNTAILAELVGLSDGLARPFRDSGRSLAEVRLKVRSVVG